MAEVRGIVADGPTASLRRRLAMGDMGSSVIRRALGLMVLVVPSQILNYALLVGATHVLQAAAFGIFYAAISITNVLIAPSAVLGLFIARHIAQIDARSGPAAAVAAFRGLSRLLFRWSVPASAFALAVLSLTGFLVGIESFLLVVLIVGAACAIYLAEMMRAALQGLQRFLHLGLAGLAWMTTRFGLAMLGMFMFATPWAGMTGVLLAAALSCALFHWLIVRSHAPAAGLSDPLPLRSPRLGVFVVGYGAFGFIMYLDVLAGYALLDREALGIYAASSVLPKAIIILTMPVGQVLFPVLTGEETTGRVRPLSVGKGLGMTALVGGAGVVLLILLADIVCDGPLAIKRCEVSLMTPLALAAVPLCLLRVLVMLQLARNRDLHPLLLAIPLVAYLVHLPGAGMDLGDFAGEYAIFAWITLVFYGVACAVPARTRSAVAAS